MSTYVYLRCLDHEPPIEAYDESGQHLYDLPQIRADIAGRDALPGTDDDAWLDLDYFRKATARFLRVHPRCAIGIRDEYGRDHGLTDDEGGRAS